MWWRRSCKDFTAWLPYEASFLLAAAAEACCFQAFAAILKSGAVNKSRQPAIIRSPTASRHRICWKGFLGSRNGRRRYGCNPEGKFPWELASLHNVELISKESCLEVFPKAATRPFHLGINHSEHTSARAQWLPIIIIKALKLCTQLAGLFTPALKLGSLT